MQNTQKDPNKKKSGMISIKVSPSDLDKIKKASSLSNLNMSEFIMGFALKKANEILGSEPNFQFLEKKNGEWVFANRKLRVFENVFYFTSDLSKPKVQDWCDTYALPILAFQEAQACVEFYNEAYLRWESEFIRESNDREIVD